MPTTVRYLQIICGLVLKRAEGHAEEYNSILYEEYVCTIFTLINKSIYFPELQ